MTRWARGNNAHRKLPSEPTSWQELKQIKTKQISGTKQLDENVKGSNAFKGNSRSLASDSKLSEIPKPKKKRLKKKVKRDSAAPSASETEQLSSANVSLLLTSKKKQSKQSSEKESTSISPIKKEADHPETSRNRPLNSRNKNALLPLSKTKDTATVGLSTSKKKVLRNLKKQLADKGLSRPEIWRVMRKETSKSLRIERRQAKTCFKCRKFGHVIADCPNSDASVGTGICFRCGSTEHTSRDCKNQTRTGKDAFPYATCFVCGEQGHLSSSCPDNPDGIYPNGGCCNECGSVQHLRKDCPDLQKNKEDSTEVVVHLQDLHSSADAEVTEESPRKKFKTTPKVIAFK